MSTTSKRGNTSAARNTKGVFLALIIISVCLAIAFTGCSQSGTTSGGSSAKSGDTTTSQSASGNSSDAAGVDESAFVGTWDVVKINYMDEESGEFSSDKSVSAEDIEAAREKGMDNYVTLNQDGSAAFVSWGMNYYGSWKVDEGIADRGLGTGAIVELTDPADPEGGYMGLFAFVNDSELMMMDVYAYATFECKKTEDKNPLPENDYNAALQAFLGTWHLSSATRDGVTITKEAGQISIDMTMEFKNTMSVTMTSDGESKDFPWTIVGADTVCVGNPVNGNTLTITDGVITQDLGENGTASYVKE